MYFKFAQVLTTILPTRSQKFLQICWVDFKNFISLLINSYVVVFSLQGFWTNLTANHHILLDIVKQSSVLLKINQPTAQQLKQLSNWVDLLTQEIEGSCIYFICKKCSCTIKYNIIDIGYDNSGQKLDANVPHSGMQILHVSRKISAVQSWMFFFRRSWWWKHFFFDGS